MHKEAWQRVYVGIRHMHREHFVFSNPMCHYVHHSSSIPCNVVFTCAGGMQESPNPPETRRRQP